MRRGSPKSSSNRSRRFSCERLEPRLMLDGVTDQVGDTIADFESLTIAPEFPHETIVVGSIESSFDRDVYRFTVPEDMGTNVPLLMTVRQQSTASNDGLDSVLTVFNGEGMLLASSDDAEGSVDAALTVLVLSGETYFVQAAGFYDSAGGYRVSFNFAEVPDELPDAEPDYSESDDYPTSPADADVENLNARGLIAWAGSLERPGDVDAFRFTATASGGYHVRAVRFPQGGFVGHLEIVDEQGNVLAAADESGELDPATELNLPLNAGVTYGIQVSGLEDSFGEYSLLVSPITVGDDYGDLPATAYQLAHPSSGRSYLLGTIDSADDVDVVRLTIASAGTATVVLARDGSALNANLELTNISGQPLTFTELTPTTAGERRLQFQATAGQEFLAHVSSVAASTGKYSLEVNSVASAGDDFANTGAGTTLIDLSPQGFGAQSGKINATGDVDVFDFIAPFSGMLLYRRVVPTGVLFSTDVNVQQVIDAGTVNEVVQAIPAAFMRFFDNKELEFVVTAGAHYRISLSSPFGYLGDYALTFRGVPNAAPALDEMGVDFESAVLLDLSPEGTASIAAAIDSAADEDFYRFVAPFTGKIFVTQSGGVAGIQSHITAFAATMEDGSQEAGDDQDPLALIYSELADDDGTGGLNALLGFEIVEGQTYYLRSKSDGGLGPYALSLRAFEGGMSITPLGASHAGDTLDAVDLVMELMGGTLASDSISIDLDSIEYLGADMAAGLFSGVGDLFANNGIAGFDRGIILTNGKAANAVGPNFSPNSQQDNGIDTVEPRFAGFVDQLTNGKAAFDTSILAFEFTPEVDVIQLRFVFASEEYPEYVLKGFHDAFGVFVNGVNYARVPGTDNYIAGTGEVISIDTINPLTHADFFVDNATRPHAPYGPLDIEYDGLTTVVTLTVPVVPGEKNEIALVIADVNDNLNDSAVFVQAASLKSPRESVDDPTGEVLLGEFSNLVADADSVPTTADPGEQHQEIHQDFIYEFLKQLGVPLVGGVLVIAVDPVDWALVGPNGTATVTRNGQDANFPNVFYKSTDSNDLIIIPNALLENYSVQLTGVGTSDFRFGASYIAPDGAVTTRLWQSAPDGRYTTAVAFDFRTLTGVAAESITLTQATDSTPPSPRTPSAPSLDGVFFAVATSARAPVAQASLSTTSDSAGGGDDSGGGEGGGSAGGAAAPTSTRLASTGSAGGKVRSGRPGSINVLSLYLDEILREIGVGGDEPDEIPGSAQMRSFLRDLLFRVHVPFLFPLDLGIEEPSSDTPRSSEGDSSPQAEAQPTTSTNAHAQTSPHVTTTERAVPSQCALAEHQPAAISSPHNVASASIRFLGAAAVAICLSMSTNPTCRADGRRRGSQLERRRACDTKCPVGAQSEQRQSHTKRARRGHAASNRVRKWPRHSPLHARRKHRFRRSSRGCFV